MQKTDEDMIEFFKGNGYKDPVFIDGFGWCAISRFIFTYGVIRDMSIWSVGGRWCFDTKSNAELFYTELKEKGVDVELPVVGIDGCTAIK